MREFLKSKFSRNAGWLIFGKIYQICTNLLVSLLMARYLGPSNYGLINYAASWTALFTSICTLGINSILVNELLKPKAQAREILGSAIGLRFISCTLSAVTIVVLAWAMNPEDSLAVQVVAIYSSALLFQAFDTIHLWYQAQMRSRVTAIITMIGYTVVTVYKIVLLILGSSVRWFALTHMLEYAVVAVLLLACYHTHSGGERLKMSRKTGMDLLSRSYHFILSGMMVAIYGQMDKIMLKSMLNDAAVGYYSAALSICSVWPFVIAAIIDAAKPLILTEYSRNYKKYEGYLTALYGVIIYVSLTAALMISLFSRPIIQLLYGQGYMEARGALCIVTWYTAFSYLGVARSIWLVPHNQVKYEKYIAACGAAANVVMNLLFIPRWGVNGAAAATLLTQIITNFLVGFFIPAVRGNNLLILRGFTFWKQIKNPGGAQQP